MSSTLQVCVFTEKNYSDNLHSFKNTEDLTMKQMFDISEKLITEQSDVIYGISTLPGNTLHGSILSLVGDEEVISLLHTKVYVFSDSVFLPWKGERKPTVKHCMGRKIDVVQKFTRKQSVGTILMVSQWNSSGTSSQDSPPCSSATKSKSYCQN